MSLVFIRADSGRSLGTQKASMAVDNMALNCMLYLAKTYLSTSSWTIHRKMLLIKLFPLNVDIFLTYEVYKML